MADDYKIPGPAVFPQDYPAPTPDPKAAMREADRHWEEEYAERHQSMVFENAQREREEALKCAQSGYLARPGWYRNDGVLSPAEQAQVERNEAEIRAYRGGLPDDPSKG